MWNAATITALATGIVSILGAIAAIIASIRTNKTVKAQAKDVSK